jgi:glutamine synthetase adenylyltransferase
MKRVVGGVLLLLLALPAARGDAQTGDDKEPPSPQKRYETLRKEYQAAQQEMLAAIRKIKAADEKQNLIQKLQGLGKEFAAKFYKLAEDTPKSPAAADALFWLMENGAGSAVYPEAVDKVLTRVGEMPLGDLVERLKTLRMLAAVQAGLVVVARGDQGERMNTLRASATKLMESVCQRAEKDAQDPRAVELLAWVATNSGRSSVGQKATNRLVEQYSDHAAIEQICETLGNGRNPKDADMLQQILEKSTKPRGKAAALLGMSRILTKRIDALDDKVEQADKLAVEAEKHLTQAADLSGTDHAKLKSTAERQLRQLRTMRVGKVAADIRGTDLDEKEFKLTDYRGKVVLLDFWGNW